MKEQKGITLIALIITIIVMLILVAVTINVALNGGIFDKAKNASEQTQVETNKEALYSAVVAAMGTDGSIDYTTLNKEASSLGFTKVSDGVYTKDGYTYNVNPTSGMVTAAKGGSGEPVTGTKLIDLIDAGTLEIGDYVAYTPATAGAYNPDENLGVGAKTGFTTSVELESGETGAAQSISQESLAWRVMGIEGEGNNRKILLISATPTKNTSIAFFGATGYNNYLDVLDNTCASLYSNTAIGANARSITMDDIDTYLGGNGFDKTDFTEIEVIPGMLKFGGYGDTKTISSRYEPQEDGTIASSYIENLEITQNGYGYDFTDATDNETYLSLLNGNGETSFMYLICNRFVIFLDYNNSGWQIQWGAGQVVDGSVQPIASLANSNADDMGFRNYLRPIVELDSSVTDGQIEILETGSNEWNDPLGLI